MLGYDFDANLPALVSTEGYLTFGAYYKGRRYMTNANPVLNAIAGGWSTSTLFTYNSGSYLRFGGALVDGDPSVSEPTSNRWFDTSRFRVLPAFTRRTNPLQYDGVKGPRFVNADATLSKEFPIVGERLKFELRGEAYNLLNAFTGTNPDTNPASVAFGRITTQRAVQFGRPNAESGRRFAEPDRAAEVVAVIRGGPHRWMRNVRGHRPVVRAEQELQHPQRDAE